MSKIADLVKDKTIQGIADLRNETNKDGIRMVIELKKDANPQVVLNLLYKHTQLEDTLRGERRGAGRRCAAHAQHRSDGRLLHRSPARGDRAAQHLPPEEG